ncbi:Uncharacterized protein FWK35_00021242 [Aphis craccivora]|uniref:Uncharacterized protein n=1 Tax=Aphis craccivora TaxID=307492 RepID=A0A6G0XAH0_APHCR|nr:Uncharacterized protein FWK35_00021242 [Aphis craccivora]
MYFNTTCTFGTYISSELDLKKIENHNFPKVYFYGRYKMMFKIYFNIWLRRIGSESYTTMGKTDLIKLYNTTICYRIFIIITILPNVNFSLYSHKFIKFYKLTYF